MFLIESESNSLALKKVEARFGVRELNSALKEGIVYSRWRKGFKSADLSYKGLDLVVNRKGQICCAKAAKDRTVQKWWWLVWFLVTMLLIRKAEADLSLLEEEYLIVEGALSQKEFWLELMNDIPAYPIYLDLVKAGMIANRRNFFQTHLAKELTFHAYARMWWRGIPRLGLSGLRKDRTFRQTRQDDGSLLCSIKRHNQVFFYVVRDGLVVTAWEKD